MNLVSDWKTYTVIFCVMNMVYCIPSNAIIDNKNEYIRMNAVIMFLNVIIFSVNEKVRKELFITNLTNSKTKR